MLGEGNNENEGEGEIGRGAKRRVDNVSAGNERRAGSYFRTRCVSSVTTAIILAPHPNPFRDSRFASLIAEFENGNLENAMNSRFQQQVDTDSWNKSIMENEESLEPLAIIMKKIAILEEERVGRIKMLEEEFRMKQDMEERF